MDAPPLAWVLLPTRAPIQVAFAQNGHALLAALVPAVVVAAIHYLWVLSTQVSFEEASLEYAEHRARLAESRRSQGRAPLASGKRKPPFALSSEGRPEMALVWKNVIAFVRGGSRSTFSAMLVVVVLSVPMLLKGGLGRIPCEWTFDRTSARSICCVRFHSPVGGCCGPKCWVRH